MIVRSLKLIVLGFFSLLLISSSLFSGPGLFLQNVYAQQSNGDSNGTSNGLPGEPVNSQGPTQGNTQSEQPVQLPSDQQQQSPAQQQPLTCDPTAPICGPSNTGGQDQQQQQQQQQPLTCDPTAPICGPSNTGGQDQQQQQQQQQQQPLTCDPTAPICGPSNTGGQDQQQQQQQVCDPTAPICGPSNTGGQSQSSDCSTTIAGGDNDGPDGDGDEDDGVPPPSNCPASGGGGAGGNGGGGAGGNGGGGAGGNGGGEGQSGQNDVPSDTKSELINNKYFQQGLGALYGSTQDLILGGFMADPNLVTTPSRDFEVGRAFGQIGTGIVQFFRGGALTSLGGAAELAPTGVTQVVGSAAIVVGVGIAAQGCINVCAGISTLWHAFSMPSTESGGGDASNPSTDPSTPTGRKGEPMDIPPGTNSDTEINGRQYSGHASDEMHSDGITPTVVEHTIESGSNNMVVQPNGRHAFYDSTNNITVITEPNGKVVTVSYGDLRGGGRK